MALLCHLVACGTASQTRVSNAVDCAKLRSRLRDAVIRVYNFSWRRRNARARGRLQRAVTDDRFQNGRLKSASALNQIYDEDDESNYEQKVDQAAANVTEQAEKPEH